MIKHLSSYIISLNFKDITSTSQLNSLGCYHFISNDDVKLAIVVNKSCVTMYIKGIMYDRTYIEDPQLLQKLRNFVALKQDCYNVI